MFIRIKYSNHDITGSKRSIQIVENIRHGNKVKQKIVRYVGVAIDDYSEIKLKALAAETIIKIEKQRLIEQQSLVPMSEEEAEDSANVKLKGRKKQKRIEDIIPVDQVLIKDVYEETRIIEGVDDIATDVYNDLGFNELLSGSRYSCALKDIVLTRLIEPYSKLKLCTSMLNKFDKFYTSDQIYRMMDKLYEQIDEVKKKVFNKTYALMPEANILLFDVTTLYCESMDPDDLREFGFSKDGKFNNTQLVLALATNESGLPICYELFPGNYAEAKTLCTAINKWRELFNIHKVCFIGDRAMFSADNLQILEENGFEYIIAAKLRGMTEQMQLCILDERNYQVETFNNSIGWVTDFDTPVKSIYNVKIIENKTLITSNDIGYILIGTKKSFTEICYISQDGTTKTSVLTEEKQKLLYEIKVYKCQTKCTTILLNEYELAQKRQTLPHNKLLLILKEDDQSQDVLHMVSYNQESILYDKIAKELLDDFVKEASSFRISDKIMSKLFKSYKVTHEIKVTQELMYQLFPDQVFPIRRLCVSYKTARAQHYQKKRNRVLERLQKQQGNLNKMIRNVAKQYMTNVNGVISLDEGKINTDQQWDGMHGIITNIKDDSAKNLIMKYSNLLRIEESFRINKHNLRMSPIYHFKVKRVKTHIALCYMTFTILKLIQYRTKLTQPKFTIDNIIETMLSVQSSILTHKVTKDQYRLPGKMSHEASALYKAFGIKRSLDAEIYIKSYK